MNDYTIDHEALRARFNPDGSLLRRHQMRMLDILIEVDRICRKHNITYWLSSGTLLGAVRHKGFIPWDDDLDIEMMWPDYKRLLQVLPEELPETMALQSQDTDPNYFFFYAKVRDRRSLLLEHTGYERAWREKGIYIDVFPYLRQPLWLHVLSEKAIGHTYKIMRTTTGSHGLRRVRMLTWANRRLLHPVLRFVCSLHKFPVRCGLGIPYRDLRDLDNVLPLTEIEFEGHLFPAPKSSHNVLTQKFGDYMRLPDLDKLQNHTAKLEIY